MRRKARNKCGIILSLTMGSPALYHYESVSIQRSPGGMNQSRRQTEQSSRAYWDNEGNACRNDLICRAQKKIRPRIFDIVLQHPSLCQGSETKLPVHYNKNYWRKKFINHKNATSGTLVTTTLFKLLCDGNQ